jgi:hypothetical protein
MSSDGSQRRNAEELPAWDCSSVLSLFHRCTFVHRAAAATSWGHLGEMSHGHPPRAVLFVGLSENPDAMREIPTGARPDAGLYSEAVGTRLNSRPARSTPTIAPPSSRLKKPRSPFKPPLVMMYSSPSPGSRPISAGG